MRWQSRSCAHANWHPAAIIRIKGSIVFEWKEYIMDQKPPEPDDDFHVV